MSSHNLCFHGEIRKHQQFLVEDGAMISLEGDLLHVHVINFLLEISVLNVY